MKKALLAVFGFAILFASCKKETPLSPEPVKVNAKTVVKSTTQGVNGLSDSQYIDTLDLTPNEYIRDGVSSWTTIRVWHKANFAVDVYLTAYSSPGHNLPQIPINAETPPILSLDPGQNFREFGFADATAGWTSISPWNGESLYEKVITMKITKVVDATGEDITSRCLIGFPYTETVTYGGLEW